MKGCVLMSYLSFSQRMGIKPIEVPIQTDCLNEDTRMDIWNSFYHWFSSYVVSDSDLIDYINGSERELCIRVWSRYLRRDLSHLSYGQNLTGEVKRLILSSTTAWYDILDFCEQIINDPYAQVKYFSKMLNDVFEIDNVGYRIIGKQISPITNETEIQSIESALALSGPFSGARIHIQTALEKYSDKTDPDYRNCVKESISAVESMCQILADNPKATLGAALKVLNNSGIDIHSALAAGFEKIYGYTSDQDGIRHAILDESKTVEPEDALFMLVSCSAFCNYLQQKAVKAGII